MKYNFKLPQAPEIRFFESAEYSRKIESAQYKMRPKPFVERFNGLNILAKIGTLFFPLISIITGISFFYEYVFEVSKSVYTSLALSLIVLSFLELIKNNLLNNGLHTFFSNSGKPTVIFIFALLFSVGSFVMSFQGAEILVKNLDKSKQQIAHNTNGTIKSITDKYAHLISLEQSKINDLRQKAKSQWHGLNTKEQNKLILIYEENIKQFRIQGQKEKDSALLDKKETTKKAETNVNYNAYVFKIFAAINEFLTVLSIVFVSFYTFKTVRQHIDLTEFRENPDKYNELADNVGLKSVAVEPLPKHSLNANKDRHVIKGFLKDTGNNAKGHGERLTVNVKKRICEHCGSEFEYKHWNKKYCSDKCRIEHWEQKTGKKLKFKKLKA